MTTGRTTRALALGAVMLLLALLSVGTAHGDPGATPAPPTPPAEKTIADVWKADFIMKDGTIDCHKATVGLKVTCDAVDRKGVLGMDGEIHCDKWGWTDYQKATCWTVKVGGGLSKITGVGDPLTGVTAVPKPKEMAGWLAEKGLKQLIMAVTEGAGKLFTQAADTVFSMTAPDLYNGGFVTVYNSVAGLMMGFVFLFFVFAVISYVISPRAEGMGVTLGGLVKAVLGISLAGVIAWLMVTLADDCTTALLGSEAGKDWKGSEWSKTIVNYGNDDSMGVIALLAGVLAIIGLLALIVIMFLRGVMIYAAGIIGAIAMVGQAHPATRDWARQWFTTVGVLAWSKFVMAALWLLGGQLIVKGEGLVPALSGVALIWIMVWTPFGLMNMFNFLAQPGGVPDGSGLAAAGMGKFAGAALGGSGGGANSTSPAQMMDTNIAETEAGGRGGGKGTGGASGEGAGAKAPGGKDAAAALTPDADDAKGKSDKGGAKPGGSSTDSAGDNGLVPGVQDVGDQALGQQAAAASGQGSAPAGGAVPSSSTPGAGNGGSVGVGSGVGSGVGGGPAPSTPGGSGPEEPLPVSLPTQGGTAGGEVDGGHVIGSTPEGVTR